jgi:hypothetical protein
MSNPFNPLEWFKSAQDWFTKAERSSGFRPYLIFLLLASGVGFSMLWVFGGWPDVRLVALALLSASFVGFIVLFSIKAFKDPDFCRSETYLHRMRKLELEHMGSETKVLPGEVVEQQEDIEDVPLLSAGNQVDEDER